MTRLSWINGLFGGLLISSCCLIQLFFNLFGIGCAGLNTLLLPYRPLFISLTIVSLTYSFIRYRPSKWHMTAIVTLTLLLSFSPEFLRMYNNQFAKSHFNENEMIITQWKIIGMHCEGCRAAVIQALRKLDEVVSVNVDLDSGQAKLTSRKLIKSEIVIQAVQSAGFQAEKDD